MLGDNRHGLIVNSCVETADGFAERRAALRERHIRPHIAVRKDRVSQGLDGRTTNSRGSGLSQHRRKLIEQPFGWLKGVACFRRTRFRGIAKTELFATFALAAYNLLRIAKLLAPPPQPKPA